MSAKRAKGAEGHPWVIAAAQRLGERGQTVAFAESCTGGLLSAMFTRLAGVSSVYEGSLITYSYAAKEKLLGISSSLLNVHGAVSVPVVRKMAEGARERLGSTWVVAITGIAGPGGGTGDKPVGTVFFALMGPGVERVARRRFQGSRREVQLASARFALRMLLTGLGFSREERMRELSGERKRAKSEQKRTEVLKSKKAGKRR